MDEKFCKDCKWAKRPWFDWPSYALAKCVNPRTTEGRKDNEYLVTGQRNFLHCTNQRDFGKCGPDGKLWEAKK